MRRKKLLTRVLSWALAVVMATGTVPEYAYASSNAQIMSEQQKSADVYGAEEPEMEENESDQEKKEQENQGQEDSDTSKDDKTEDSNSEEDKTEDGKSDQDKSEDDKNVDDDSEESQSSDANRDEDDKSDADANRDEDGTSDEDNDRDESQNQDDKLTDEVEDGDISAGMDMPVIETESGSLGKLFADYVNTEQQTEANGAEGYGVYDIQIDGSSAIVEVGAIEPAEVIVGIYAEDGTTLYATGTQEVLTGDEEVTVSLDMSQVPQYFIAKAYLVDYMSHRPLCKAYVEKDYSKLMQDFYAKETTDFPAEKVLNLDRNQQDNFMVYQDEVIILKETAEQNKLVSADREQGIYTFSDADEKMLSLKEGDIIAYYPQGDQLEFIIEKLASVKVDGTSVTVTATGVTPEEVFTYIKIDSATVQNEPAVEGGITNDAEDITTDPKKIPIKEKPWEDEHRKVTAGGYLEVALKATLWEKYIDFDINLDFKIYAKLSGSYKGEMKDRLEFDKIPSLSPVPGVYFSLTPYITTEISGKLEVSVEISKGIGIRIWREPNQDMQANFDNKPLKILSSDCKVSAKIGFTVGLEPSVSFISKRLVCVGIVLGVGPELSLETNLYAHGCALCFKGEVALIAKLGGFVEIAGNKEKRKELVFDTIVSQECYLSSKYGYGMGKCPDVEKIRVPVQVKTVGGVPVKGAVINGKQDCKTNANGMVTVDLKQGLQVITAELNGQRGSTKLNVGQSRNGAMITLDVEDPDAVVKQIDIGARNYGILTESGKLFTWGAGECKDLKNASYEPALVPGLEAVSVEKFRLGNFVNFAISRNGALYSWGSNNYAGCLGRTTPAENPEKIYEAAKVAIVGVVDDAMNENNTSAAITKDGSLYVWGDNGYGQIGDGSIVNKVRPTQPAFANKTSIAQVDFGSFHTIALSTEGQIYTWGLNDIGQLGYQSDNREDYLKPHLITIAGATKIVKVYAEGNVCAALDTNGRLYMWGETKYGQLVNGKAENVAKPTRVGLADQQKVQAFHFNGGSCEALLNDGTVWVWGSQDPERHRLGINDISYTVTQPTQIPGLSNIVHLYDENRPKSYTLYAGLNKDGKLYQWGGYGKLEGPMEVAENVKQFVDGYNYTDAYKSTIYEARRSNMLLDTDGRVFVWGDKRYGITGDGTHEDWGVILHNQKKEIKIVDVVNKSYANNTLSMMQAVSTEGTLTYDSLVPSELYNLYIVRGEENRKNLSDESLLYIGQGKSDEQGKLNFTYKCKAADQTAYAYIVCKSQTDLSSAEVVQENLVCNGEIQSINPTVKYQGNQLQFGIDYTFDGNIEASEVGEYEFTVYGIGEYTGSVTQKFRMVPPIDWGEVEPDDIPEVEELPKGLWVAGVQTGGYAYTGTAIKPGVRVYDGNTRLIEKTDYTITYKNNIKANDASDAKTAPTIIVTGKGNYSGKEAVTFRINPLDLNDEKCYADDVVLTYKNMAQKPAITVVFDNRMLKNNVDYTYVIYKADDTQYANSLGMTVKDAGNYVVRVTGKGNYTGSRNLNLKVDANLKPVSKLTIAKIANVAYTGQPITPEPIVKEGTKQLTKGTDYLVEYKQNTEVGTAYVLITGVEEKGYVGTKRISFKITGENLNKAKVELSKTEEVYTGKPIVFDQDSLKVTVRTAAGDKTLKAGDHYNVTYQNNVKAGIATIVVTGINGYVGSTKKTFRIVPVSLKDASVKMEVAAKAAYAKKGAIVLPVIKRNDVELIYGKDYTVAFRNHKKVGITAEAVVKGIGNYKETLNYTYAVEKQDMSKMSLQINDKVFAEKKNNHLTKLKVLDLDGGVLTAGTDYDKSVKYTYDGVFEIKRSNSKMETIKDMEVSAEDIIPAGTVIRATVSGKNSYEGTVSGTFRITTQSLDKAKVKVKSMAYTGKDILLTKEDITCTIGNATTLAMYNKETGEGDFEVIEYKNNRNRGKATATIKGHNNYGGTKVITFTIAAKYINYTIVYHKNAEDATGEMKDSLTPSGAALSANKYVRSGYRFKEWNTKADGTGHAYKDKETFRLKSIFQVFGTKEVLYAQWEKQ